MSCGCYTGNSPVCGSNTCHTLELFRGQTHSMPIVARDQNHQPFDLTLYSIYFSVKHRSSDISPVIFKRNDNAGGSTAQILVDPDQDVNTGLFTIFIDSDDTLGLLAGQQLLYDCWLTLAGARLPIIPKSDFILHQPITLFMP